jgi:broad specificity phosphatase PhoE
MKLYLMRHGQTFANVEQVYAGHEDVALTEKGRMQATRLCSILKPVQFDAVYSSDLSRAIDTQKIALPEWEGERTPLLREFHVGALAGQNYKEMAKLHGVAYQKARDYSGFGGESAAMVKARLSAFLEDITAKNYGNVAVFAHHGILVSMLEIVLQADFNRLAVNTDNCSVSVFEYDGSKWILKVWNYTGSLLGAEELHAL